MFLAPAFLFGLLAIGVPLWLHRVTRANPQQQPFGSLMFLEASESQRTAKHTIRYWLLLALRIALLAALVFAFAGPLIADRIMPRANANARLHAIVLDASFSMQHGERWRRALAAAESVLNEIGAGDRVMLVRAAGRRIEVLHEPTFAADAGVLQATLGGLRPSLERLDFGLAMSTADNWLGSPRPPAVLHFISDLQQSGAPLRFADLEPPPGAQLQMHSVAGEAAANAFIADVALAPGDERTLQATIRHNSTESQQRELILLIDGEERARRRVELRATPVVPTSLFSAQDEGVGEGETEGGAAVSRSADLHMRPLNSVVVSFPDVTLTPGAHRIELQLEPKDALPQDDRHFAVIEHADPKALLIARGESADDAAYFGAALGALDSPRLTVEQRSGSALDSSSLSGYSLAVIADASTLSSAAAARMIEYVAAGGAVLATLGGQEERLDVPLLKEWRVGEARARTAKVGEISTTHPALREAGDWRRVRFFRQRVVDIAADDKVLISYEDGAPLLVERTIGAGRMLVLTAPIDRRWNDLAIHPLFVQFIAEAGRYLSGADASPVSHTAGSVVMTGLTAAAGGQIFDPQGERVLGLAEARTDRLIPRAAGFYEIRSGAGARWLAVNVDARESDLTPLPPAFVQRWRALRIREPAAESARVSDQPAEPRSLGPLLVWIAAGLLLAEMLLANRYLAIRRE